MAVSDLNWSDKLSTGITVLDQQHQQLLFMTQNLLNVLEQDDRSMEDKQAALLDVVKYALAHFADEERVMRNIGYPEIESHMREHDDLRQEIAEIQDAVFRGQDENDWKGLIALVQVWVLRHIVSTDTKIREFILRENDVSLS